ncbi:MAG: hypothetical protein U0R52_12555 [Solirubrobacterales bacterium]
MRRKLVWAVVPALAALGAASAAAENTQQLSAQFSTTKAPKQRRVGGSLNTITTTGLANPNPRPGELIAPPTDARVYFDDDIDFDSKGLPACDPSKLTNTITSQARRICAKSIVGGGKAVTAIGGQPSAQVLSVVTAFNGPKRRGHDTLVIHNRSDAIGTTVVLIGTLREVEGRYGSYLDTPVPPLPLDSSVISFQLRVSKAYRVHGHRHNFVAARCADPDHTWNFKSRFTYDGNDPLTSFATQKCTVRR